MSGPVGRLIVDTVHDGVAAGTVRVRGEVDMSNASSLAEQLSAATSAVRQPAPMVADLTGVTFLGSAGLAVLVKSNDECRDNGVTLRIVASHPVRRAVEVTGLDEVLSLYATLEEARSATS